MESYDVKRFVECWVGLPSFREDVQRDLPAAANAHGIDVDPAADLLLLVDGRLGPDSELPAGTHPAIRGYLAGWIMGRLGGAARRRRNLGAGNPTYARWRARQIGRFEYQEHALNAELNSHIPFAVELSAGCSLGCKGCGLDARKLSAVAPFDAENELLFREILLIMGRFVGVDARSSLLYFATEPLDNPDYESYLETFYDEIGWVPETTTALWFRDLSRARSLLTQIRGYRVGAGGTRFSVNSRAQLLRCLRAFSARDLADVTLVLNFDGSLRDVASAGRGRRVDRSKPGTIACITGFLINLSTRTARLVSPSLELERWPLGYRVYAECHFQDAPALSAFVEGCEAKIMAFEPADDSVLSLGSWFTVGESGGDGLTLRSQYRVVELPAGLPSDLGRALLIEAPLSEVVERLSTDHDPAEVREMLRSWWDDGFLEDPRAEAASGSALLGR